MKMLFNAIKRNDYNKVKQLLKKRININARDESGWTPLIDAAWYGYKEIAELLIQNGAEVNAKNDWGETALIYSAKNRHKEVTELLIQNGADINVKARVSHPHYGKTALMYAVENGHKDIAKVLVQHGADIFVKNNQGKCALDMAYNLEYDDFVGLLTTNQLFGNSEFMYNIK